MNSTNERPKITVDVIWLLPILLLLAVMPLLMYNDTIKASQSGLVFLSQYDLYTAVKAKFILILGPVTAITLYFSNYFNGKTLSSLRKDPVFYALFAFIILNIVSYFFASYKDVALYGIQDRYEGLLVILCYFVFWLATFIEINNENQIKWIIISIYLFTFVSFVIGFTQFIGKDILISDFVKQLIIPKEFIDKVEFKQNVMDKRIYLTLFNQNYVGSFMSMVFGMGFVLFLFSKSLKSKIVHATVCLISFFLVVGSTSRVGFIAIIAVIVLIFAVLFKFIIKNIKSVFILFAILGVTLFSMNAYLDNGIFSRYSEIAEVTRGVQNTQKVEPVVSEPVPSEPAASTPTPQETANTTQKNTEPKEVTIEQLAQAGGLDRDVTSYSSATKAFKVNNDTFTYTDKNLKGVFNIEYKDGMLYCYDAEGKPYDIKLGENESKNDFEIKNDKLEPLKVYYRYPNIVLHFSETNEMINVRIKGNNLVLPSYNGELVTPNLVQSMLNSISFEDGEVASGKIKAQVINDFDFSGSKINVKANKPFSIELNDSSLLFKDENGEDLDLVIYTDANTYYFMENGYEGIIVIWDGKKLQISAVNPLQFIYDNGKFNFVDLNGKHHDTKSPEIFKPLEGKEMMFSGRGYIWARSIPLLNNNIVKGKGPDTFIFYFPQYDLAEKEKVFQTSTMIVDKPHNTYLQIGLNSGVISLVVYLLALAFYVLRLVKTFKKVGFESVYAKYAICCLSAIVAYCVAAIINDSVIYVASMFWVVFGMGCAINRLMSEESERVENNIETVEVTD